MKPAKLYYFPVAPNPTKLRVYLAEKGIEIEQALVNLPAGEQNEPEHLRRHPLGALPVLELSDGSFLTESLAIIEFFEELHPDPPMIGRDPLERARVRELERMAELRVLGPVARTIHATRSPLGLPANPEVAAAAFGGVPRALDVLEERIGEHAFLAGEAPTIADCTLFAAFGFAGAFQIELPSLPRLGAWHARLKERWPGY